MAKRPEVSLIDAVIAGGDPAETSALRRVAADTAADPHRAVWPGDVWVLGEHRLICGDSTDPATVAKLLAAGKPHLMVTDPPYGVQYDADWRNNRDRKNGKPYGASAVGLVRNDERSDWRATFRLFPGDVAYVWHGERSVADVYQQLIDCRFVPRNLIVWNKQRIVLSRGHYNSKHETCWYAVKGAVLAHWSGDMSQATVWDIEHLSSDTGHSTQKPVECMLRPILNNSAPGDLVYEPFCGSGTTIIAAERSGRRCRAVEISPLYCYVALARWAEETGRDPTLDGEPLPDVVARRRGLEPPQPASTSSVARPFVHPPMPVGAEMVAVEAAVHWHSPDDGVVVDPNFDRDRAFVVERLGRRCEPSGSGDLLLWVPAFPDTGESDWYPKFLGGYVDRIKQAIYELGKGKVVAIVQDYRHSSGLLYGFCYHTMQAFSEAGARFVDEMVVADGPAVAVAARRRLTMLTFEVVR